MPFPGAATQDDYFAALYRISQVLNSSLEPEEVLDRAMDTVIELLGAERGYIMLADERSGALTFAVARNLDRETVEDPNEISQTVVQRVVSEQAPFVALNAGDDDRLREAASVVRFKLLSVLCAPLLVDGRLVGVVYLDNRLQAGAFEERDAEVLMAFANIAAIAIRNARLHTALRLSGEERLRLQKDLHEQELQRVASERISRMKSEMVAWVSHELSTPLSTLSLGLRTLLRDTGDHMDPKVRCELYEVMNGEANRMVRLVRGFLDLARLEQGLPPVLSLQIVDLGQLATRVTQNWQQQSPRHRFSVALPRTLPRVYADPDRVGQVLHNLLSNAVKYSPDGGAVRVEARDDGDHVVLNVSDEGLGMSPQQMNRLFQPYQRGDADQTRRIRGTGLGLHLVKHLVEAHGGTVWAESAVGQGSTFHVRLPLAATPSTDHDARGASSAGG